MREVITDIKEAVGDTMGVTVRLSLDEAFDELSFSNTELRDCIEMNAELPDLWDFAHGTWEVNRPTPTTGFDVKSLIPRIRSCQRA